MSSVKTNSLKTYLPITCEVLSHLQGRVRTRYDELFMDTGVEHGNVLTMYSKLPRTLPAFFREEDEPMDGLPFVYLLSFFPEKVFMDWASSGRFSLAQVVESLYPCFRAFEQRHDAVDAFIESVVEWERRAHVDLALRAIDVGYKVNEQQSLLVYLTCVCCTTPQEEAQVYEVLRGKFKYVYDLDGFRARMRACRANIWVFCGALLALAPNPNPWLADFLSWMDLTSNELQGLWVFFAYHSPYSRFVLLLLPELYLTRQQWARFTQLPRRTFASKAEWLDVFLNQG